MPILRPAPTLNPMKDVAKVEAIDYTADFENLFGRLDAHTKFYHTGKTKKGFSEIYTRFNKTSASGTN